MKQPTRSSRVPAAVRLSYPVSYFGISVVDRVVATWAMYYYLPPEGRGLPSLVPPVVFGFVLVFGRLVDAVADPLVSAWTDRCRSRRGRRVPFLLAGGAPLALSLVLLFHPPHPRVSAANALYLALVLGMFFFFFTLYVCPYLALIPELGKTPAERINITTSQAAFMLAGVATAFIASGVLIENFGFRTMAWVMAAAAALAFYAPLAALNEKKHCASLPSSMSMFASLRATISNRPFLVYLCGTLSFWFGFNIVTQGVSYYLTVLMNLPEGGMATLMALNMGVALASFPAVNLLSRRLGKRAVMLVCLALFSILLPMIYLIGHPANPLDPRAFGYTVIALAGIPLAALFVVPNAIVADLTDFDEKLTGERRESMYFGAQGLFLKLVLGGSSLVMSLMFNSFGYAAAAPLGVRLTGPAAAAFAAAGFIAFLAYPESKIRRAIST
ncbi:MAG: MFS transporter [bacterium]